MIRARGCLMSVRSSTAIPGRWGEAQSIPGSQFINPLNPTGAAGSAAYVNVPGINYANPVRAGYSINIRDILSGLPPDAADDNFNTYDPYPMRPLPLGSVTESDGTGTVTVNGGEVGDADYYDAAGALLFRFRADAAVGYAGGHQRDGACVLVELEPDAAW